MKNDVPIKNGIIIPESELTITASRAGGPGGQHVNKTSTRITVHWNVKTTNALTDIQKQRVLNALAYRLTNEGELIIHSSQSRSQQQNRVMALSQLAQIIRKALHVPKKRIATKTSKAVKEKRLQAKKQRSEIKKGRSSKYYD